MSVQKNDLPMNFRVEVMRRYMEDKDIRAFYVKYAKARQTASGMSRSANLAIPITDEDMAQLKSFLQDTDISVKELSRTLGYKEPSAFSNRVRNIALRLLSQKGDKMFK